MTTVTKNLHVTFGSSKRILQFQEGEEVKHLRHHFLRVFSDVLSDEVAPTNVSFQSYDKRFDDYLDLAKVVHRATSGSNQSQRSKILGNQSESSIWHT